MSEAAPPEAPAIAGAARGSRPARGAGLALLRPHRARARRGVRARLGRLQGRGRRSAVRPRRPERPHARRPLLHRRERLQPHLRAHAGRQHGARVVLPARRLHRLRGRAEPLRRRGDIRLHVDRGLRRLDPRARHRLVRGRRHRPRHAAALPALEPGPGAPPGADHDRDLGHHRRPDARPLRRHRRRDRRPEQFPDTVSRSTSTSINYPFFRIFVLALARRSSACRSGR